jgi:hypothetical protein
MIRTVRRDGARVTLTEWGWPTALLGVVMIWVTLQEMMEAGGHDLADYDSRGAHAANVGGDAASGTTTGAIAVQLFLWPLVRRLTVDPAAKTATVRSRWLWKRTETVVPIDDIVAIGLTVSGQHAYAVLVRADGTRVRFSSAFRLRVVNELEQEQGAGRMARYFGGA